MTDSAFLDTNVILRHFLADHPEHSPRATALLEQVRAGEQTVHVSETVVFEAVFTMEKFYKVHRALIRELVEGLLGLPGVLLPTKGLYGDVFEHYVTQPSLSFADCFHAVLARHLGLREIFSFDRGFDRIPDIVRIEPS